MFESDRFSIYALAYLDETEITNPDTYDGIFNSIVIGMLSIMRMITITVVMRADMKEFKN